MTRRQWMLRSVLAFACLGLGASRGAALLDAPEVELLRQQSSLKTHLEDKIQSAVLDPILGKERAKVFANVEMEYVSQREDKTKIGAGMAQRYKEKEGPKPGGGFADDFILPGVPRPKAISANPGPAGRPAAATGQMASQEQEQKEQVFALRTNVKSLLVTVIHDEKVPQPKLDAARERIVDALSEYKATPEQIVFRKAKFDFVDHKWQDDLKNPNVYLPLLYALLLLLFLLFLFGPLWSFFRRYIHSLGETKKQEITSASKVEQEGENEGEGLGGPGGPEENKSMLDIMLGRKPPEPPPPPPEEDEMKKFEPFSYITEENLKRLVSWFLLRREEPWLIGVVLSYLRPDLARRVLTSLPLELQAKVALEALMVRQVTREQVVAIDNEVKENIDFVVGGLKRLTQLLEEADGLTRSNIMDYLKNQKPAVYDRVRKLVLTFEDVIGFPDREMQVVVRELKTDVMARALQNATPDVVNKFFTNMSPGAASLLKESMEYTKGLTHLQVEEERTRIVDHIKGMEKEGRITIRERLDMENFQEELAVDREDLYVRKKTPAQPAPKPEASAPAALPAPAQAAAAPGQDPAMAQQYFEAAAASMQSGASEQAIQYFRQAVLLDPNLWQAYQYMGGLLYQMGQVPEAMAYYEEVLKYNPDPQLKAWVESYKAQAQ
ncbi:MAG: tetratricopeptide repeat protein [Elusimicrobia bacterium]|nr:tetratricopeptide repeat protein [Elusimicrobiota bacterium]